MRCVVAILLLSLAYFGSATFMGVDLGSEFLKIAGPKAGNAIDIVLNEQTRRKSFNYVGFRGDDRYFGEDAKNFAARFPDNMITMLNRLVGLSYDHPDRAWFQEEMLHSFTLLNNTKRGTIDVKIGGNPDTVYSVEELLGMMFAYMKDMTEKDIGENKTVRDATVAVPSFFDTRQRQAIVNAAALANVRVLSVIHATTATALQYGIQNRGFGNETLNVVFFDVGSSRTEAGVYTFSPTPQPKTGKIKAAHSLGTITKRFIASDRTLGSRTFDKCLAVAFEKEFHEQTKGKMPKVIGGTTVQQHKSLVSLMRAANKAKEMLSANKVAPVTVEGIAPDRDFNTKINREEFEELCKPLFDRAIKVAEDAIKGSGLDKTQINAFELMGGGSRLPKIFDDLSEMMGRPVDRTLNSDEAAALGTAFHGARVSGYFRVKSFLINDEYPEDFHFTVSKRSEDAKEPVQRPLFIEATIDGRKSITLPREDDFNITLRQNDVAVSTISVNGVQRYLTKFGYGNHSSSNHSIRVELKLSDCGVAVEGAELKYKWEANVTKKIKIKPPVVNTTDGSNATSTDSDDDKKEFTLEDVKAHATVDDCWVAVRGKVFAISKEFIEKDHPGGDVIKNFAGTDCTEAFNNGPHKEEQFSTLMEKFYIGELKKDDVEDISVNATDTNATDGNATATEETEKKPAAPKYKTVNTTEIRKKLQALTTEVVYHGIPVPMSQEDIESSRAVLQALDASDERKKRTAAAKNDLETYLIAAKTDGLLEHTVIKEMKFMSEEEEKEISEALAAATEWLEDGEGSYDDATQEQFEGKLQEMLNATSTVRSRLREYEAELEEIRRNETIAREKKRKEEKKKKAKKSSGKKAKKDEETAEGDDEEKKEEGSDTEGENKSKERDSDSQEKPTEDDDAPTDSSKEPSGDDEEESKKDTGEEL